MSKRQAELAARFASYQKGSSKAKVSLAEQFEEALNDLKSKLNLASSLESSDLRGHFDELHEAVQLQLEKLAESASQLNSHERQKIQVKLEEFEKEVNATSQSMLPKKRFAFSSKKVAAVPSNRPTAQQDRDAPTKEIEAQDTQAKWIENRINGVINIDEGQSVSINNCRGCKIIITTPLSLLRISKCENSSIYSAPVSGSVYVEETVQSTLQVCCRQFRAYKVSNCNIFLYCTSKPTIDTCQGIGFAPYSFSYPLFAEHFKDFGGSELPNMYKDVQDFNWLHLMEGDEKSPNWRLLEEHDVPNTNISEIK